MITQQVISQTQQIMEVVTKPFTPAPGSITTALSLGTLYTHKHSKLAFLIDAVSCKTYEFPVNDLRRILGSIKILEGCNVHIQRHFNMDDYEAEYRPVRETGFLWGNLEFDWDDLNKINKAINHGS